MSAHDLRVMADRCRELLRIAARDEVRDQLRQWAVDLDEEADELDAHRAPDPAVSQRID